MTKKLSDILNQSWSGQASHSYRSYSKSSAKRAYKQESFDFIKLIEKWPLIVGEKLAEQTAPLKNRAKTLTVLTKHAAFSQQISFMEGPLRKKIIEFFPALDGKIERINFISNPSAFVQQQQLMERTQKKSSTKESFQLHPQSPEYKRLSLEALEMFKDVEDEQMKASLKALYLQFQSQEKR